jgi:hypothetical protein
MLNHFITSWDGSGYRSSDIERIGRTLKDKDGWQFRVIHMRDGSTNKLDDTRVDELLAAPAQLIPALPGTSLIRVLVGGGVPGEILREPAIGWALCNDGEVRIVTANGVSGGGNPEAETWAEMPDGSVQAVGQWTEPAWFKGAAEMLDHFERGARAGAALNDETGEKAQAPEESEA